MQATATKLSLRNYTERCPSTRKLVTFHIVSQRTPIIENEKWYPHSLGDKSTKEPMASVAIKGENWKLILVMFRVENEPTYVGYWYLLVVVDGFSIAFH